MDREGVYRRRSSGKDRDRTIIDKHQPIQKQSSSTGYIEKERGREGGIERERRRDVERESRRDGDSYAEPIRTSRSLPSHLAIVPKRDPERRREEESLHLRRREGEMSESRHAYVSSLDKHPISRERDRENVEGQRSSWVQSVEGERERERLRYSRPPQMYSTPIVNSPTRCHMPPNDGYAPSPSSLYPSQHQQKLRLREREKEENHSPFPSSFTPERSIGREIERERSRPHASLTYAVEQNKRQPLPTQSIYIPPSSRSPLQYAEQQHRNMTRKLEDERIGR